VIVDTSALLAFFDSDEPDHVAVSDVLASTAEPLIISPYVVAELDYLVASRLGTTAELAVLRELAGGAWDLPSVEADEFARAADVIDRYDDQSIGLADASNVVLAHRFGTRTIATLDRRHFNVLRPIRGGRFRIVP
jgi:uncharacterized protein